MTDASCHCYFESSVTGLAMREGKLIHVGNLLFLDVLIISR